MMNDEEKKIQGAGESGRVEKDESRRGRTPMFARLIGPGSWPLSFVFFACFAGNVFFHIWQKSFFFFWKMVK